MSEHDAPDPVLAKALAEAAEPVPFPGDRIEDRIDATLAGATLAPPAVVRGRHWVAALTRWGGRLAAAAVLLVGGVWYGRATAPVGSAFSGEVGGGTDGGDLMIDLTGTRQLSPTAVDAGLGMTLRCAGCQVVVSNGRAQWTIPAWPVVASIAPDGVAAEAGLRVGDRIASIAGTDIRAMAGASPMAALPAFDFTIGFERDGQRLSAIINRRITDQIIIGPDVRVRVTAPAGLRARLGSFFVSIGRLLGGEPSPRPAPSR